MAGEDFSDLVATYSESPDKDNNGEIGLSQKQEEIIRIFGAEPDDADAHVSICQKMPSLRLSPTDSGSHLFQVVERRPEIPFDIINKVMDKGSLRGLVDYVYRNLGAKATVILADRLKDIGYKYSTKGGLSISIDAMIIPEKKGAILNQADTQVIEIGRQYTEGLITQGEKYNKVVDIWAKATDDVANEMMDAMKVETLS
jgi:DNA-directed RNA polymerase subunit beta'